VRASLQIYQQNKLNKRKILVFSTCARLQFRTDSKENSDMLGLTKFTEKEIKNVLNLKD
jgi:hypothetical protein